MGNLLCVAEVATLGGVTTNAVRKAIRSGKLPASGGGYHSNGEGAPYVIAEEDALEYFKAKPPRDTPAKQPAVALPPKPQRDAIIKEGIDAWYSGRYNVVTQEGEMPDPRGFWIVNSGETMRPCRIGEELKEGEFPTEIHFRRGGVHWEYRRIRLDSKGRLFLVEPTYHYEKEEQ